MSKIFLNGYIVSLILIYLSGSNFTIFSLLTSFFLLILFSINLVGEKGYLGKLGYSAFIYSGISLILIFLMFFYPGSISTFFIFTSLFFIPVVYFISRDFSNYYPVNEIKKESSKTLIFIKYFVFILVMINLVLISTISIHEFSHISVSRFYDCESRAIFYEQGVYPYSEINCPSLNGRKYISLAGPVFPIILAIIIFFVNGLITKSMALLSIGFNLLASNKDFKELLFSDNILLVTNLIGIGLLILGLVYLAKFILEPPSNIN